MPPNNVIEIESDNESSDDETYDDESYDDESSDEQQKSGSGCPPAPLSISRTAPSDGRYHSASHNHHGDGDQTSGLAHRHPPGPGETGEPTKDDGIGPLQAQERRGSPSVLPDHQSISEPDDQPCFPYQSSPSAASEYRVETQHRSGSSALSQHGDHHDKDNQINDPKQRDARLPGDRGEQGVESSLATSQVQERGARIPRSSEAMSNNDRVLADVGPSVQPSLRPSARQDRVRLEHSFGHRPRSGTDAGEKHRPVKDGVREHDREDVTQPPPKRRRISTSTPAVGGTVPHRSQRRNPKPRSSGVASTTEQALSEFYEVEAILGLRLWYLVKWKDRRKKNAWVPVQRFKQYPELLEQYLSRLTATQVTTPLQTQLKMPEPRSAGVASMTKQARRKSSVVEDILSVQVRYLVKWKGYEHKDNTWEPAEHFNQCHQLLQQFHEMKGSKADWIVQEIRKLKPPSTEARRSAA